jgi:gliding motility-associated lipoprotein GldH
LPKFIALKIPGFVRILLVWTLITVSCTRINVFEKNVPIPDHQWNSQFKPSITFDIKDTAALYNIYVVLRHTYAYKYSNIWMNVYTVFPGDSSRKKQPFNLTLAVDDKGWLGSGMDDIYEHRAPLFKKPIQFPKAGEYTFILENIMREDPLQSVMNAGIRIEKLP